MGWGRTVQVLMGRGQKVEARRSRWMREGVGE